MEEKNGKSENIPITKLKSYVTAICFITIGICVLSTVVVATLFTFYTAALTGNPSRNVYNVQYGDDADPGELISDMMGGNVVEVMAKATGSTVTTRGSGVVVSFADDGSPLMVTNYHVVEGNTVFYIRTIYENEKYARTASLLGYDAYHDIAVLKLQNVYKSGTFLDLYSPETEGFDKDFFASAVMGERLYAIGNALGEGLGIFDGICTNPSKVLFYSATPKCVPVLQTTAAINKGMSGGPIFNRYGQVVGIGTFKGSEDDISYGVPARVAQSVFSDIMNGRWNDSGKQQVVLFNYTVSSKTVYNSNITYSTISDTSAAEFYTMNVLSSPASNAKSATNLTGMGFSGLLGSGRGDGSQGLVDRTNANGITITKSAVAGLNAGDVITKIGDKEITSDYGEVFNLLYTLEVRESSFGKESAINLTLSDGRTVLWQNANLWIQQKTSSIGV